MHARAIPGRSSGVARKLSQG